MHVYIMRHGIAFEREEWDGSDESRPLTEQGQTRTRAVVEGLEKRDDFQVTAIWSSPLARALETAQIAGLVLGLKVKTVKALAGGTTLKQLRHANASESWPKGLLLVGHEPDCATIIGELVGDLQGDYTLKKAGVASLEGEFKPKGMRLKWKLTPKEIIAE